MALRRGSAGWRIVGACALVALSLSSSDARGGELERCVATAEHGQQLRDEGRYRAAREELLVCARPVCPGPIRTDCTRWLTELERDAPTVVLGARGEGGRDLVDVKVSLDGAVLAPRLDGRPVLVDAGEHEFVFEAPDGSVRKERVLLRSAEKARPVVVSFGAPGEAPATNRSLALPIALGGLGVAALGSFVAFGSIGKSEVDDLRDTCEPACSQADLDAAKTKLIVADISLGAGIVLLGVATWFFVTRSKGEAKAKPAAWRFDAAPLRGGAAGAFATSF